MKKNKKIFILIESVLAVMVLIVLALMFHENNKPETEKVSVIVQNSDDDQWAAFKYGLKMAAEDQKVEMFVVSTGDNMTAEEEAKAIGEEIENGADALVVQPLPGEEVEEQVRKAEKRLPVILVGQKLSGKRRPENVVAPDNHEMGAALAKEILKDYNGDLTGKTVGLVSEREDFFSSSDRAERLGYHHTVPEREIDYTVMRRDTLFSEENQRILFTMSQ